LLADNHPIVGILRKIVEKAMIQIEGCQVYAVFILKSVYSFAVFLLLGTGGKERVKTKLILKTSVLFF